MCKIKGKLYAIGIGPGAISFMTKRAIEAIEASECVVGYSVYIEQVKELLGDKEVFKNHMGKEIDRCKKAVLWAKEGKQVALVCSGDSGVYGMAGLLYELLEEEGLVEVIDMEVIPGVTAALSCSALLGAPIVEDFCTVSLSDYMTPYDKIEKRVALAGEADFTIAIYNPRSKKRPTYLQRALDILLETRGKDTPVGIVKNAFREGQEIIRTTLGAVPVEEVDMFSTVIVGNSNSRWIGENMVTSRGYQL